MYTPPIQDSEEHSHKTSRETVHGLDGEQDAILDLRDIFLRLARGLGQVLGLAVLGAVVAVVGYVIISPSRQVSTSTRVVFAFPGFGKGQYPDKSRFQPDDLRSPDIIAEALKRLGLDTTNEFQSQIRGALDIEGIFSPDILKEHDRLRITGQPIPFYIPDEYIVTLSLPRNFSMSKQQRAHLLNEIVSVYRENFQRTYASTPAAFGNAFDGLKNSDFPEYDLILNKEIDNITTYLTQQIDQGGFFRSPTTNLSFKDLLDQTQLFAQTQLSGVLALIYQDGLARNREIAMTKMAYSLRNLANQERHAVEDEKVVSNLLAQTQAQAQNYVLGIKSQVDQPHAATTTLDQGLVDSLLANDAYNFLVRRELDAGLRVKQVQADKAQLLEQLETLKSSKEDAVEIAQIQKSLDGLEPAYNKLIDNIRKTQADFSGQQFPNAIRITDAIQTSGMLRILALVGAAGCLVGLAAGIGLSLLGIYIGSGKKN